MSALLGAVRRQPQDYAGVMSKLCSLVHKAMQETRSDPVQSLSWRRLYTDTALIWALLDVILVAESAAKNEKYWETVIERLDKTIVIAGAPGEGRLDTVLDSIEQIQKGFLTPRNFTPDPIIPVVTAVATPTLPSANNSIPVLSEPPSLSSFRSRHSKTPFILRSFGLDWPAIEGRKWASKSYLHCIAGRGRIVPVEIGRDYRTDDWSQRMMNWDDFLDYLFSDSGHTLEESVNARNDILYLAQHDLFKQFPALRRDIIVPDYVYASLPSPDHYPQYRPPANDEELILNVWFGPRGATSPAHVVRIRFPYSKSCAA